MANPLAEQVLSGLVSFRGKPSKEEWQDARERFRVGDRVEGRVALVVPFGLLVELDDTVVTGVVLGPNFADKKHFDERAVDYPVGTRVALTVTALSEGRLQIDLTTRLNQPTSDA